MGAAVARCSAVPLVLFGVVGLLPSTAVAWQRPVPGRPGRASASAQGRRQSLQHILSLETPEDVLSLVSSPAFQDFGRMQVLFCFLRLGKLWDARASRLVRSRAFQELVGRLDRLVSEDRLDSEDLSSVLLSAAYVGPELPLLVNHAKEKFMLSASAASARDLSNSAWAVAKLADFDSVFLARVMQVSVAKLEQLNILDLSKLCWACATLRADNPDFVTALSDQVMLKHPELSPRGISNFAWSFARLQLEDAATTGIIMKSAALVVAAFKMQELVNVGWAAATLAVHNAEFMRDLCRQVTGKLAALTPQGLSNFLWALASLRVRNEDRAIARLERAACARAWDFKVQELANTVWALAKLDQAQHAIEALSPPALQMLHQFSGQQLANIAWALATLRVPPGPLLQGVVEAAYKSPTQFNSQGISNLVWSLAKLKFDHQGLLTSLIGRAGRMLEDFNPEELSVLLWSLATLRQEPGRLTDGAVQQGRKMMRDFGAQDLSYMSWAFATLVVYNQDFMAQLGQAVLRVKSEAFADLDLANIAWSFAALTMEDAAVFDHVVTMALSRRGELPFQALAKLAWSQAARLQTKASLSQVLLAREVQQRVQSGRLEEEMTAELLSATLWALHFSECLDEDLLSLARLSVVEVGRRMDLGVQMSSLHAFDSAALLDNQEPTVVLDLPDRLVIHKPPNWEVNDATGQEASGFQLSAYCQALFENGRRGRSIMRDFGHRFGFLHRLDVPSSGLILVAKTYSAFYDLQLQLHTGQLRRVYYALLHGWLSQSRGPLQARMRCPGDAPSRVSMRGGRPAVTQVCSVHHAMQQGQAVSLCSIQIGTGRRHQIRTHMAYVGHPVVCDAKFGSQDALRADLQWCPRNALHRCRLSFLDGSQRPVHAHIMPPDDLNEAAALLRLREGIWRGWDSIGGASWKK